ncbi:hypothetical protein PROVRUST_05178 [Providencia rustigianii DSM 4541]|uniref:Uncharacterized protein n=1 Tax=Providencia rustigianii DSM 4541 TaxID=500637 RepID=D1NY56_9GAMM|nr:hypothetical protein PROVRUST_05178 [Providencia rustigianii DSM 4541]
MRNYSSQLSIIDDFIGYGLNLSYSLTNDLNPKSLFLLSR